MREDVTIFHGGFQTPVFQAQETFHGVMHGFAEPGTVKTLNYKGGGPRLLPLAAAAIALTLFDETTPVWLSPELHNGGSIGKWLAFHTGAPVVEHKTDAHFALFGPDAPLPTFESFAQGSQDYPDRSATLILPVSSFDTGEPLVLTGPGIKDQRQVTIAGLPDRFLENWQMNARRFPNGIDVVLISGLEIMCLPRTTKIKTQES